jgi:hypothetical protein
MNEEGGGSHVHDSGGRAREGFDFPHLFSAWLQAATCAYQSCTESPSGLLCTKYYNLHVKGFAGGCVGVAGLSAAKARGGGRRDSGRILLLIVGSGQRYGRRIDSRAAYTQAALVPRPGN